MKVSKIRLFFGYRFVLNTVTREIHDLSNTKKQCQIKLLVNYKYITKRKALKLIKSGKADGCIHCLKSLNLE